MSLWRLVVFRHRKQGNTRSSLGNTFSLRPKRWSTVERLSPLGFEKSKQSAPPVCFIFNVQVSVICGIVDAFRPADVARDSVLAGCCDGRAALLWQQSEVILL